MTTTIVTIRVTHKTLALLFVAGLALGITIGAAPTAIPRGIYTLVAGVLS